jgi:hypothetical protein
MSIDLSGSRAPRLRLLALLITLFSILSISAARPPDSAHATSEFLLNQYRTWMAQAREKHPYPQTLDKMWRVMMCESSGNAYAVSPSGTYKGLFQYHPNTWSGSWNPYRGSRIWDAKAQIFATARAWSIGMQSHWSCYYITPGR